MSIGKHKPSLHNFGAKAIYVINDISNVERKNRFIDDWNHFSDFNYEFVAAEMGTSIEVNNLINSGRLESFWCGEGAITKNILGCYESHRKVWEKAEAELKDQDEYVLILEDDARLTPHFLDTAYSSGEFHKVLEFIKSNTVNCFWWGRADNKVIGDSYNDFLKKPDAFIGLGAHGYMVSKGMLHYLLQESQSIKYALDVFLDVIFRGMGRQYSPNFSYIRQVQHMTNSRFLAKDHPLFVWTSTTQPDRKPFDTIPNPTDPFSQIHDDMSPYISEAEFVLLQNVKSGIEFKFKLADSKTLI